MKSFFTTEGYADFLDRVNSINANQQNRWGKMNAAQMMKHLSLAIGGGLIAGSLPDVSNLFSRTVLKIGILYISPGFPKNAFTAKPLKVDYALDFENAKSELLHVLNKAYKTKSDNDWHAHPLLGKLSRKQWGILITKHLHHHLRQFGV